MGMKKPHINSPQITSYALSERKCYVKYKIPPLVAILNSELLVVRR